MSTYKVYGVGDLVELTHKSTGIDGPVGVYGIVDSVINYTHKKNTRIEYHVIFFKCGHTWRTGFYFPSEVSLVSNLQHDE